MNDTDDDRRAMQQALTDDNAAVEALAAAHGALLRAVQAISSDVHSVFRPADVGSVDAATRLVALVLGEAENAIRARDVQRARQ